VTGSGGSQVRGSGSDDKDFAGGVQDVDGECVELVDADDAFGLGEEADDEPEVAGGDADGGGEDGVGAGAGEAEVCPAGARDLGEFGGVEGVVVVDEADAVVELGVAGEAFSRFRACR
jgi:hypothetical protein